MTMRRWVSAALLAVLAAPASAATCDKAEYAGASYAVCRVEAGEDLRLWLTGADGAPMATFERVREALGREGLALGFAMNAGMYHPDRSPVGLYVEDGREVTPIVTAGSRGNFGMRPNGVFCAFADRFAVIESRRFAKAPPDCRFATQSGPMLVIGGDLHPRFLKRSDSRNIRNGVGVTADGSAAIFVMTDVRVTFYEFATFFRDGLGTPDALFLDGSISRLYAPALDREDFGLPMGPIVGVAVLKE
jgi:uncharacterized protein YigE (DUF2233 family)